MSEKTTVYAVILNPDDGIGGFDWYYAQEDARERAAELKATLGEHQVLGVIDVRVDVPAADSEDPEQEITDEIDVMLGDLEAWVADPVHMWDGELETLRALDKVVVYDGDEEGWYGPGAVAAEMLARDHIYYYDGDGANEPRSFWFRPTVSSQYAIYVAETAAGGDADPGETYALFGTLDEELEDLLWHIALSLCDGLREEADRHVPRANFLRSAIDELRAGLFDRELDRIEEEQTAAPAQPAGFPVFS